MKVLFVIAIALCAMVCDAQVAPQELKKALLDLYKATKGDTWTTKTNWNTGNDICTWYANLHLLYRIALSYYVIHLIHH